MKVLVLGCKGQLGRCLNDQLADSDYDVIYTSRDSINVVNIEETKIRIADLAPNVVINASGYTAVDKAEEDQLNADLVNHIAVSNLANICRSLDCLLIHVSTDYVFDGWSTEPYKENDVTNPQGIYGVTKLQGELSIESSGCKYLIIRTAWVFSEYGNNFLKTMLRLGAERSELSVVGDQIGCPTYAQDLARAIAVILSSPNLKNEPSGIYHFAGHKPCSWYDFSEAIFAESKKLSRKVPDIVRSIATADYKTLADRPMYSVLDSSKITDKFGIYPSDWTLAIRKILRRETCYIGRSLSFFSSY
jgi:dTDP-4-dehydrorhamnose reductase